MNEVGFSEDKNLVEAIELKGHKWFVGCQFHPNLLQIQEQTSYLMVLLELQSTK